MRCLHFDAPLDPHDGIIYVGAYGLPLGAAVYALSTSPNAATLFRGGEDPDGFQTEVEYGAGYQGYHIRRFAGNSVNRPDQLINPWTASLDRV